MTEATSQLLPELDSKTLEELQPPCEIEPTSSFHTKTTPPARWIVAMQCENCGRIRRGRLLCDEHFQYAIQGGSWKCKDENGTHSNPLRVLSSESL